MGGAAGVLAGVLPGFAAGTVFLGGGQIVNASTPATESEESAKSRRFNVAIAGMKKAGVVPGDAHLGPLRMAWDTIVAEISLLRTHHPNSFITPAHSSELSAQVIENLKNVSVTLFLAKNNREFVKAYLSLDRTEADWSELMHMQTIHIPGNHWSVLDADVVTTANTLTTVLN